MPGHVGGHGAPCRDGGKSAAALAPAAVAASRPSTRFRPRLGLSRLLLLLLALAGLPRSARAITPTGEMDIRQSSTVVYLAPGDFGGELPPLTV